jgi:1,4-dihydroxy-6-naphthoate synthase
MFYAVAKNLIDLRGLTIENMLVDIQTLNEWSREARLDMTALSLYAWAQVADKYTLLPYGMSMGEKYGPVLISKKPMKLSDIPGKKIAIPGFMTSAYCVFKICFPDFHPVAIPFDKIMGAITSGAVDAGVIIHEGQVTYEQAGFHKVVDMGEYWYEKYQLPLPLGVNAVKSSLDKKVQQDISQILKETIRYAMEHREDALAYALSFGRGLPTRLADKFVGMYVNDFSEDMGDKGRQAVQVFLDKAFEAKLLPRRVVAEYVPSA